MSDDDEEYPPQGGCLGTGALHDVAPSGKKRPKLAIGFVHFKDKPEMKAKPKRRPAAKKAKRRKR